MPNLVLFDWEKREISFKPRSELAFEVSQSWETSFFGNYFFAKPLTLLLAENGSATSRCNTQLQPLVLPHVSHFRQVPLRTMVKFEHSEQLSPV